jgi:TonB family protein
MLLSRLPFPRCSLSSEGRIMVNQLQNGPSCNHYSINDRGSWHPGHGLERQAMETVENWRFTPATGPDGKRVACVVTIEVTFRLG